MQPTQLLLNCLAQPSISHARFDHNNQYDLHSSQHLPLRLQFTNLIRALTDPCMRDHAGKSRARVYVCVCVYVCVNRRRRLKNNSDLIELCGTFRMTMMRENVQVLQVANSHTRTHTHTHAHTHTHTHTKPRLGASENMNFPLWKVGPLRSLNG